MTQLDEIGDRMYRIHTPVPEIPGGFSFNQILVVDDEPLLFHTGGRRLFPGVRAAIERVLPIERLRWIGFSHLEADECGALNDFLAVAPHATPVAGRVGATIALADSADRPARALDDGEVLATGTRRFTWFDTPHLPHGWECGYMFEATTRTLLCGDLFTQPGAEHAPVVDGDILGPSEAFRARLDYFSHARHARAQLERLAATAPRTLACMHGSAWTGDGAKLLGALAAALEA
jgi:flavorubredoxin